MRVATFFPFFMSEINVRTETVFGLCNWVEVVDDVTRFGLTPLAGGGAEIGTLVRDGLAPREIIPGNLFGDDGNGDCDLNAFFSEIRLDILCGF